MLPILNLSLLLYTHWNNSTLFHECFQASQPGEVAQRLGQEVHLTTAMTKALTEFLKSEIEKRNPSS